MKIEFKAFLANPMKFLLFIIAIKTAIKYCILLICSYSYRHLIIVLLEKTQSCIPWCI